MLDLLSALSRLISPLWEMSVTAAYAAAVVIVLRLVLKKRAPKQVLCLLWLVVFARLLIPVSLESPLSIVPDALPGQEYLGSQAPARPGAPTVPQNPGQNQPQNPTQNQSQNQPGSGIMTPVTGNQNPSLSVPEGVSPTAPETEAPAAFPWQAVAAGVWLTGAAAMGIYAAISYLRLRRRLFGAIRSKDGVWEHPAVDSPFILGVLRPKIYLPAGLTGQPRQFILCHERAHLRRFDHIVKPVCWIALALHWFNPLAWTAFLLMSRDIEAACDEAVVRQLGSRVKADYSDTLLALATGRRLPAPIPLAFDEGDARGRIRNVLNYRRPALWVIAISVLAAALAAVCLLTDPVTAKGAEGDPDPEATASNDPGATASQPPVNLADTLLDPWMKGILDGERTFFTTYNDRAYTINDLESFFFGDDQEFNFSVWPGELTIIDLNRDGINELVINPVTYVDSIATEVGHLILHRVGDEVYGYDCATRAFYDLKTDGTFSWSNSAFENGFAYIRFSDGIYLETENASWCDTSDRDNQIFFVDGRKATQEEYDAARSAQNAKPDPIWYTYADGVLSVYASVFQSGEEGPASAGTQADGSAFAVQAGASCYRISYQLDLPGEIDVIAYDFVIGTHEYWTSRPKGIIGWTDQLPEGAQALSDGGYVRRGLGFYDGSLDAEILPPGVSYREWYYPMADGALYLRFRWDETDLETAEAVRATLRYSAEKDPYVGEYLDTNVGEHEPSLKISMGEDGKYSIQISIFRLTTLSDGVGEDTGDGIRFTATDASGNPIGGTITVAGQAATVTFTDSTWGYLPNGTSFQYTKCPV